MKNKIKSIFCGLNKMKPLIEPSALNEEIQKLKQIKEELAKQAPDLCCAEVCAAIYRELATADRAFFAANKY